MDRHAAEIAVMRAQISIDCTRLKMSLCVLGDRAGLSDEQLRAIVREELERLDLLGEKRED